MSGLLVVSLASIWSTSSVSAQVVAPLAAPSDPRAQFVSGNVVTCAGAGILVPGVIQVGAQGNQAASDPNVAGVVQSHAGGGEELNVTIAPGASIVIDGVIVKGGNGFNLYTDPTFLPPTLPPPQRYISPLVGVGNIPAISHWFICYHETAPVPTGTLEVAKTVLAPPGVPVTPLPTSFSALVNCDDDNPAHQNVTINFGLGGGRSASPDLVGIPEGTVCTVVEQTGNAPTVTYVPAGADAPGVTITAGDGVLVTIINDFSDVPVQRGTIHVDKVVLPGLTPPESFTALVACDDGTTAQVTLPGAGGPGTPDVSVRTLSFCALTEIGVPGFLVSFSVNGGPASFDPPIIAIVDSSTVTVTVTNDPAGVIATTTTTTSTTTTTTTLAPTTTAGPTTTIPAPTTAPTIAPTTSIDTGVLPPTGTSGRPVVLIAALLVAAGATLVATRRRSHNP